MLVVMTASGDVLGAYIPEPLEVRATRDPLLFPFLLHSLPPAMSHAPSPGGGS